MEMRGAAQARCLPFGRHWYGAWAGVRRRPPTHLLAWRRTPVFWSTRSCLCWKRRKTAKTGTWPVVTTTRTTADWRGGRSGLRPIPRLPEVRATEFDEKIVRANGLDLCVETFGDPADLPILLISGTVCSMDWWERGEA